MVWSNVRLIWMREIRDQLRDRRTVFMIAVLPVLLYPLLGMVFLQITQFMQQQPARVWVLGAEGLAGLPPLFAGSRFVHELCPADEDRLIELIFREPSRRDQGDAALIELARREIHRDGFDAIVVFPSDFSARLAAVRADTKDPRPPSPGGDGGGDGDVARASGAVAAPAILFDQAGDTSRIAADRIEHVLNRWREAIVREALAARGVSPTVVRPFVLTRTDISEQAGRRAAVWSRVLPFVVVVWALTGAFYPAIDLCAGEKERGTLETLLCSPATRAEIVGGKLLTVACFSAATAYLNLLSLGVTGAEVVRRIGVSTAGGLALDLGFPPPLTLVWLLVATLPIVALFSALSLAIAAFAHSAKEGQYYLMPLLLIAFPLMTLPVLPTARLDLGTSLIPVTGMVLWLRFLIEGQYGEALRYAVPVLGVTIGCCALAVGWAVRQFHSESVLFRQGDRGGMGIWLRRAVHDRGDVPSAPAALFLGLLILLLMFFVSLRSAAPTSWTQFALAAGLTQVALVATPALVMTWLLARRPRRTLLLTPPPLGAVVGGALLAVALHPLVVLLSQGIEAVYPMSEDTLHALAGLTDVIGPAPLWQILLVLGALPAICEELAFRGFILSGLLRLGAPWAIGISSVLFGLSHGLLQQSLSAIAVGFVLGYLAVQSRSLFPGVVFHLIHNSLAIIAGRELPRLVEQHAWFAQICRPTGSATVPFAYQTPIIVLAAVLSVALLLALRNLESPDRTRASRRESSA